MTFSTPRKRPKSLSHALAEHISAEIRQGKLKPGDKLPTESSIMELHDVSRTVVREAISQLQAAGLVQTRHGIGTFIQQPAPTPLGFSQHDIITLSDVLDILELRISLETEAAWLAASRRSSTQMEALSAALAAILAGPQPGQDSVQADLRFHTLIAEATGNRYFVNILRDLGNTLIPRARLNSAALSEEASSSYLERVNREHEDIHNAIQRQDPEGARAAMRTHLSNSRERIRLAQQKLAASSE